MLREVFPCWAGWNLAIPTQSLELPEPSVLEQVFFTILESQPEPVQEHLVKVTQWIPTEHLELWLSPLKFRRPLGCISQHHDRKRMPRKKLGEGELGLCLVFILRSGGTQSPEAVVSCISPSLYLPLWEGISCTHTVITGAQVYLLFLNYFLNNQQIIYFL
jgi:hypothetical protein